MPRQAATFASRPDGLLVEHAQLVVVGHELGEPVDVTAIDAVDEADDRRNR